MAMSRMADLHEDVGVREPCAGCLVGARLALRLCLGPSRLGTGLGRANSPRLGMFAGPSWSSQTHPSHLFRCDLSLFLCPSPFVSPLHYEVGLATASLSEAS